MEAKNITREILDSLHEGLYVMDPGRNITFWNKGAEKITGFPAREVMGKRCSEGVLMHVDETGASLCEGHCPVVTTLSDGQFREREVFLQHRDGHRVPVRTRVAPLRDDHGAITGVVEMFSDNSSRLAERRRLKELEEMALLDALTKLPNRHYLAELLHSRMAEFQRVGWQFGLLFMDLDNFKWINDTFGHKMGDETLKSVGNTLAHVSRPYDVVGRWGGDEFLGLATNVNLENLTRVAERYRALVGSTRLKREQGELHISLSIGGALSRPGDSEESLLARADHNQYQAKKAGRDRVVID